MWADAIMNHIMNKDKRAGESPNFYKDYNPQKVEIQLYCHLTQLSEPHYQLHRKRGAGVSYWAVALNVWV